MLAKGRFGLADAVETALATVDSLGQLQVDLPPERGPMHVHAASAGLFAVARP